MEEVSASFLVRARQGPNGMEERWRKLMGLEPALIVADNDTAWVVADLPSEGGRLLAVVGIDAATGNATHSYTELVLSDNVGVRSIAARGDVLAIAGSLPGDDGTPDFGVLVLEADNDDDGVANSQDGCPSDPGKTQPGLCGCGLDDMGDVDRDGVLDCVDRCADDPEKWLDTGVCGCGIRDLDGDRDGWYDCEEECPQDPEKRRPGTCGCGASDQDSDRDGLADCVDPCPSADDPALEDGACPDPVTGCQCQSARPPPMWLLGVAWLGVVARRRTVVA